MIKVFKSKYKFFLKKIIFKKNKIKTYNSSADILKLVALVQ